MASASGPPAMALQSSEMLSRDQLLHLFARFDSLTSQPDVKRRIADAVKDKQEAVAVTTAIQEEILLEMGIDPRFGITCLGKVNAMEEIAIDEAELESSEFEEKMLTQQTLQEQQLDMLKQMRKYHPDAQSALLEALHEQLDKANFDSSAAVLTSDQIEEIVRRRQLAAKTST
ncbi:hypothetical protein MUK42_09951 [Musa troglodytarum]|uniref:Uncharacterized protein n=1 Tax=Musa troglodytarum TaxID=320322 RepID=A0A9E7EGS5_9LILI|nr:hypothetical protein MUK42_09951 [Musa troglodytarum]